MVRQIGMALEMPYEVLVMHFQSSYSAARAALLMAWKAFRAKRDMLAKTFCQPTFELWLADEVAEGRINAPGFFADDVVRAAWCAAIWTGDGPGSIDPDKEVTAAQKRVDLGISTKQAESIAFDGIDWQQKHEQRVKEINAEKADGIYIPPAGSPAPASTPPTDPNADPNADPSTDPATDPPTDPADPASDGTPDAAHRLPRTAMGRALAAMTKRLNAIEREPRQIHITTPPVTVTQGDVHVNTPPVTCPKAACSSKPTFCPRPRPPSRWHRLP